MDQQSRNKLQNATQDARQLLEAEFAEQLEGTYDILPDGTIHDKPGVHLNDRQRLTRRKLVDAIQHRIAGGKTSAEAVVDYTREAAFTFLNRFVALKMLEARELVQQCVSTGEQSSGFKEFTGLAPGLAELPDKGYRLYLECLFDELSIEVKILFDRQDVASLLWPGRQALEGLLATLNQTDLDSVWDQDETIGWVYQYFNSSEERKKMREESQAPRNSHELAVRNQFFTPRYVVEFLTDNTLGRIWYEMQKGKTQLVDECRYMVRRPSEVFLDEGQEPPIDDSEADKDLSQEELLKKTVYIPYRPKKDPRDLKILDPACGSGHFLLYCFDLLLTIYEEAWHDKESPPAKDVPGPDGESPAKALHEDYETIDALHEAVPGLILRHNLYGIEIDPRCGQIAAFALWLQAQRAYSDLGTARNERPPIRKTNIVIAEPMPGEPELLKEFTSTLNPPLLGKLVEASFEKMKLAGEAGSLLKIEEEIRDSITKARQQWGKDPEHIQMNLFGPQLARQEKLDFSGITDDDFWHQAEERIYEALHRYVTRMSNGQTFSRRLFAEDTERGFAFIDLCRNRYDVVLMNPPFGEASEGLLQHLDSQFPAWNRNLLCAFVQRQVAILVDRGVLASVMDRSPLNKSTYEKFRREVLLKDERLRTILDLGWEVLDANVEVACCIVEPKRVSTSFTSCIDIRDISPESKDTVLLDSLSGSKSDRKRVHTHLATSFSAFPNSAVVYDLPDSLLGAFFRYKNLKSLGLASNTGHQLESDRHFMFFWEIPTRPGPSPEGAYCHLYNGGNYCRFAMPPREVARFGYFSNLSPEDVTTYTFVLRNRDKHFLQGVSFGVRGEFLDAHVLPGGVLFTVEGQALPTPELDAAYFLIGLLNSAPASRLLNSYCGQHKYSGYVNLLPCPPMESPESRELARSTAEAVEIKRRAFASDETSLIFSELFWVTKSSLKLSEVAEQLFKKLQMLNSCLKEHVRKNDALVCDLYGLHDEESRADVLAYASKMPTDCVPGFDADSVAALKKQIGREMLSYCIGGAFGRWDIQCATSEKPVGELSDAFAPLPICPPGQLQNDHGLPITREEVARLKQKGHWDYPIEILWDGILVDDPGHPLDLKARVHLVLQVIWKDRWEAIEHEACEILGVHTLRDYFRKPAGFFTDHLKRYSKSRRKAPIYWQLATPSASYSAWLYYHCFTKDTFYKVLNDYLKPKLEHEQRKLDRLRAEAGPEPTRSQRGEIDQQEKFVAELKTFAEEIERIAPLWNPNLNDGVIINYAPLWRLVSQHKAWQKECKKVWDKLVAGEYDWAHLAMHLWPERVVSKCRTDASLAIAHGLEEVFWEQDAKGKWAAKDAPDEGWESTINKLVAERTSPAVKAALDSLLNAPAPGNGKKTQRIGKRRKKSR